MNPSLKLEKAEIILEENHFSEFPLFKKKSHMEKTMTELTPRESGHTGFISTAFL